MANRFLATDDSLAAFLARLALGIVIFPHGAQKLLGWFGGPGFNGTLDFFAQAFGVPAMLTMLVILAEFFGGLGLVFGLLTRLSAIGVGLVMLGAVVLGGHLENGFFMNWTGQQAGEGFEFHLLAIGLVLVVLALGGGRWSVDRAITRRKRGTVRSHR
ncbi:MAG TPA: DoxX family protein [Thermoanaerobaculia bacterium]